MTRRRVPGMLGAWPPSVRYLWGFDSHHCTFPASEAEFDAAFARLRSAGITCYAGPHHGRPGEINHLRGGRGVYFDDPDGHTIEVITRPCGDPGSATAR